MDHYKLVRPFCVHAYQLIKACAVRNDKSAYFIRSDEGTLPHDF